MAIFGNLTEIPLLELLRTLGKRTGKLSIALLPQEQGYHLYIDKARLRAVHVDGQVLRGGQLIRQAFIELSKAKDGHYTFKSIPIEVLPKSFDVPLKPLLETTSTQKIYKNRLPAPQTRFVLSKSKQQELESWQSNSLKAFWKNTALLFDIGSSAEEISQTLNIDVKTAQLNIYKLRVLGQISPIRSFEGQSSSNSLKTNNVRKPHSQNTRGSTFAKDMSNLNYKDINGTLKQASSEKSPLQAKTQPTPTISRPNNNRKLVSHLLRALRRK